MADEPVTYFPGKYVKCGGTKITFENNNFKPYEASSEPVGGPCSVNLLDENKKYDFTPEFIKLGPVTPEEIEFAKNHPPGNLNHPPVVKDISREQFATAVQCYDDLVSLPFCPWVSVMVYPELELVLKAITKQLSHLLYSPVLSWEDGKLAINGVKTKLRACEAFEAVRSLCKLGSHERASKAVAELLVEKLKELF